MSKARQEWSVLGRVIGTGTGWDSNDTLAFCIYDFEPLAGIALPATEYLSVDLATGQFSWGEDNYVDIISTIKHLPEPVDA